MICGDCNYCCTDLRIDEDPIRKAAGVPCRFLKNRRCEVYEDRPPVCFEFRCVWQMGILPTGLRPDECGVMMIPLASDEPTFIWRASILVRELWPNALSTPLMRSTIDALSKNLILLLVKRNSSMPILRGPDEKVEKTAKLLDLRDRYENLTEFRVPY
jgi:hypothetical protein